MTTRATRTESDRLRSRVAAIQARDEVSSPVLAVRLGLPTLQLVDWMAGATLPERLQRRVRLALGDEAGAP